MNICKNVVVAALALGGLAFAGVAMAATPATAPMAMAGMNWFGGPVYTGAPALDVTAALVEAGGGAASFDFAKALVSMLGEKTVNAEVAKLNKQYGEKNMANFLEGMSFAIHAGLNRATEAGVKLPAAPADLKGIKLAQTLVSAGTAPDGVWWSGYLFDKALSNPLHVKVMIDIDAKYGHGADQDTHKILNQAMFDVAQALKVPGEKLAPLHYSAVRK